MEFSAKLRKLMGEHRYSQDMIAQRLDVSQNLVSRWARGVSLPDLKEGKVLAELLGVSVDYLADDGQDRPPSESMTDYERRVWEIVREIGPERVWRRLVRNKDTDGDWEPHMLPPPVPKVRKDERETG